MLKLEHGTYIHQNTHTTANKHRILHLILPISVNTNTFLEVAYAGNQGIVSDHSHSSSVTMIQGQEAISPFHLKQLKTWTKYMKQWFPIHWTSDDEDT